ncbi:PD-(D/E)XK nuclease family protein [Patescibacteria group bacterium]|nr:PD-(D/E)XK nuclease family protein [Patescibacteria group bacterium]
MLKNFPYTPILGWSVSRYGLFEACKRKYYYTYYAKHDLTYPRKKIDDFKNMTSIPLEIGNIVHDANKTLLGRLQKTERKINQDQFFNYAWKMTQKYCSEKEFMEVYYGEIKKPDAQSLFDQVKISLRNFLDSQRFEWLTKEAIQNKAEWIIEPAGYGETRIGKLKAYCKVDFLFPVGDNLFILDWKTGKADSVKHNKQLLGYASWASFHFAAHPEKINPIIVYLHPDYEERRVNIENSAIQNFGDRVKRETEEMYEFCVNINENIPLNKEMFPKTDKKKFCDYCNFRELCR